MLTCTVQPNRPNARAGVRAAGVANVTCMGQDGPCWPFPVTTDSSEGNDGTAIRPGRPGDKPLGLALAGACGGHGGCGERRPPADAWAGLDGLDLFPAARPADAGDGPEIGRHRP